MKGKLKKLFMVLFVCLLLSGCTESDQDVIHLSPSGRQGDAAYE